MSPKIQLFIKGFVTVACKSALIFLSGEKKRKEVREEGKKGNRLSRCLTIAQSK